MKFAAATAATPIAGCFAPGTFPNQIQAAFWEPRLLVVPDPWADHQPPTEASVNLWTIALCNTDSPLCYVAIAILCSNKGAHLAGLMWGCWPGKFCACVVPSPTSPRGRSCLISASAEILKGLKRKSRPLLKSL